MREGIAEVIWLEFQTRDQTNTNINNSKKPNDNKNTNKTNTMNNKTDNNAKNKTDNNKRTKTNTKETNWGFQGDTHNEYLSGTGRYSQRYNRDSSIIPVGVL